MHNKTTGPYFHKYGNIVDRQEINSLHNYTKEELTTDKKEIGNLISYNQDIYLECTKGIAMLCCSFHTDNESLKEFAIHRIVKLNKNTYFNIISMTPEITYTVYYPQYASWKTVELEKTFTLNHIESRMHVDEIYSYYYSVKSTGYNFDGEAHEYFELTYVDNGEMKVEIEDDKHSLTDNQLIICGRNQFHKQSIETKGTCSYLTIIFDFSGFDYHPITNKVFKISPKIHELLSNFVEVLDKDIILKEDLLITILKLILILLYEYDEKEAENYKIQSYTNHHYENEFIKEILTYINNNLSSPLSVDDLCETFSISRSSLQKMFSSSLNKSPKQYINEQKLKMSRLMIKESTKTIGEIANALGFNSIHYFSRKFTSFFKVTPSDYAKSIYKEKNNF
ncbi:MAG: AraC family transcriptional regulator [Erysipelotrichaceae bacterium]